MQCFVIVWTAKAAGIIQEVIRANQCLSSKPNEALKWNPVIDNCFDASINTVCRK